MHFKIFLEYRLASVHVTKNQALFYIYYGRTLKNELQRSAAAASGSDANANSVVQRVLRFHLLCIAFITPYAPAS